MIKIIQVQTRMGEGFLIVQYSVEDEPQPKTAKINTGDLTDRLLVLSRLLGRELTDQDLKDVLVSYVNELRLGGQTLRKEIDWQSLIGVDLEAEG